MPPPTHTLPAVPRKASLCHLTPQLPRVFQSQTLVSVCTILWASDLIPLCTYLTEWHWMCVCVAVLASSVGIGVCNDCVCVCVLAVSGWSGVMCIFGYAWGDKTKWPFMSVEISPCYSLTQSGKGYALSSAFHFFFLSLSFLIPLASRTRTWTKTGRVSFVFLASILWHKTSDKHWPLRHTGTLFS